MNHYTKWASREYTFKQRLLALIPAGFLFVLIIPYILVVIVPRLDSFLHLPVIFFGIVNLICGCLFMVTGAIYAFWSIISQIDLARGTPLPMMPTQKLLVSGPFKQCRNPMTFGTIFLYLGIGIIIGSLSSIAVVILFGALLLIYIKLVEERELEARFGQEYMVYKATTPFILPRISSRRF
jgi:protein-S-isoprenylcysteine O-methyltransferase Ste14